MIGQRCSGRQYGRPFWGKALGLGWIEEIDKGAGRLQVFLQKDHAARCAGRVAIPNTKPMYGEIVRVIDAGNLRDSLALERPYRGWIGVLEFELGHPLARRGSAVVRFTTPNWFDSRFPCSRPARRVAAVSGGVRCRMRRAASSNSLGFPRPFLSSEPEGMGDRRAL